MAFWLLTARQSNSSSSVSMLCPSQSLPPRTSLRHVSCAVAATSRRYKPPVVETHSSVVAARDIKPGRATSDMSEA